MGEGAELGLEKGNKTEVLRIVVGRTYINMESLHVRRNGGSGVHRLGLQQFSSPGQDKVASPLPD
jgi:hypothetical protein